MQKSHLKGRPANFEDRHLADLLVSVTESCLREKSHLDLTTREIAKAAGTHVAMINYYFNGKNGLLATLVDSYVRNVRRFFDEVETEIDKNGGDPLERIVRQLVAIHSEHWEVISLLLVETLRPTSAIAKSYGKCSGSQFFSRLSRIFKKLIDKGVYREGADPNAVTWLLLSLIVGRSTLKSIWQAMGAPVPYPECSLWSDYVIATLRKELSVEDSAGLREQPAPCIEAERPVPATTMT